MNLKPAGIKTVREAIERVMAGEVFYSPGGWKIIYDDVNAMCDTYQCSPFKAIEDSGRSEPINHLWERVSSWQIEYTWEDGIGDGVLCWVSDFNRTPGKNDCVRFITAYDGSLGYPYRSRGVGYKFAIPIKLEEAKKYVKG